MINDHFSQVHTYAGPRQMFSERSAVEQSRSGATRLVNDLYARIQDGMTSSPTLARHRAQRYYRRRGLIELRGD